MWLTEHQNPVTNWMQVYQYLFSVIENIQLIKLVLFLFLLLLFSCVSLHLQCL